VSKTELNRFEDGKKDEMGFISSVLPSFGVTVNRSEDSKCGRCWTHRETVGKDPRHPLLCARCAEAVG
jgi:isoleucyl-tRNA synthetase